jgi:hypothetical protein
MDLFEAEASETEPRRYDSVNVRVGTETIGINWGRTYFVTGDRPDKAMRLLRSLARADRPVLCISRLHPDLIDKECAVIMTETFWLSERPGPSTLPPEQLLRITQRIADFVRRNQHAVVVIDGIEYLSLFNDFAKVHAFVEQLNDLMMESAAVLLVPVDPRLFDSRSMARLRRFAEIVA